MGWGWGTGCTSVTAVSGVSSYIDDTLQLSLAHVLLLLLVVVVVGLSVTSCCRSNVGVKFWRRLRRPSAATILHLLDVFRAGCSRSNVIIPSRL